MAEIHLPITHLLNPPETPLHHHRLQNLQQILYGGLYRLINVAEAYGRHTVCLFRLILALDNDTMIQKLLSEVGSTVIILAMMAYVEDVDIFLELDVLKEVISMYLDENGDFMPPNDEKVVNPDVEGGGEGEYDEEAGGDGEDMEEHDEAYDNDDFGYDAFKYFCPFNEDEDSVVDDEDEE